MLIHIIILILSSLLSFIFTLYTRNWFFKKLRFFIIRLKKERTSINIDSNGIPYVDYGYRNNIKIGIQRNPVTVTNTAMKYYQEYVTTKKNESKILFINNANWLLDNTVNYDKFSTLEYYFPLPIYNLEPPWLSAMANGQALQIFCLAHKLTNDVKYLINAQNILKSFFVDIDYGGITYKDSTDSWWYEEYAAHNNDAKESRVLNGMLFALVALYDYYKYTDNNDAKILFDKGVTNVIQHLNKYDDNGYSYYDILENPSNTYHKIHIDLLNQLYNITSQELLKQYSDKWYDYYIKNLVKKTEKNQTYLSFYRVKKNILFHVLTFLMLFIIFESLLYISKIYLSS